MSLDCILVLIMTASACVYACVSVFLNEHAIHLFKSTGSDIQGISSVLLESSCFTTNDILLATFNLDMLNE